MSDIAHTTCHVAKSGLCSHNLFFVCIKMITMLGVFPSFDEPYEVIVCNGTVWQRMVLFFIVTMRGGMYMAQISINNLTFGYEGSFDYVFENVSFSIDTNWKLGFIGRNGKGKTTF